MCLRVKVCRHFDDARPNQEIDPMVFSATKYRILTMVSHLIPYGVWRKSIS